ncbi:hypothetical protein M569_07532, partial [Genlisea aurea]
LLIPLLAVAAAVILILFRRQSPNLPPSPARLPIIGNLHQIGFLPHRSLKSLSDRYGPLMLLRLGASPVLIVSSSAAAREIMKVQDVVFADRPYVGMGEKLFYGSRDLAFAPYGEYWRQMRSICAIHLFSIKKVESFSRIREEEVSNTINKIRAIGTSSSSAVVNLSEMIVKYTNDVICRATLGRKYGDDSDGERFKDLLAELARILGTVDFEDYIPWLGRWINRFNGFDSRIDGLARELDEFLESILRQRREKTKKKEINEEEEESSSSFIDILLEFQMENRIKSPVEDEAIKAVILVSRLIYTGNYFEGVFFFFGSKQDMFAAGTDTISTAIEWTMAELLKNPTSMKILREEMTSFEISKANLDEMRYLKAVIKETFRLHPPIPLLMPHKSTRRTTVFGYDVAPQMRVIINAWAIGQDPSLWEDPEQFKPERFLKDDTAEGIDYRGLNFELIPFGAGRRGCPGMAFATSTMLPIIAKLVQNFHLSLPDGEKEIDLEMNEAPGISVTKKYPLLVV